MLICGFVERAICSVKWASPPGAANTPRSGSLCLTAYARHSFVRGLYWVSSWQRRTCCGVDTIMSNTRNGRHSKNSEVLQSKVNGCFAGICYLLTNTTKWAILNLQARCKMLPDEAENKSGRGTIQRDCCLKTLSWQKSNRKLSVVAANGAWFA